MRRLPFLLSTFTLLLFYFFTIAFAQDFDFPKAYQDYLYNYNLYRTSHDKYLSAKNEYLAYKTLTSETRALEATREMLKNRTRTLQTYLTAIRMKLGETTGIINYQQNLEYLKLDTETNWLSLHQESLSQPGSIADLLQQSSPLEEKYPQIELLSYQTLGTILGGKENSLRERVSTQAAKIEEKITEMKNEGEDVAKLERWLTEAKKKIARSEEKQVEAELILKNIKPSEQDKKREFSKAQIAFEESNQSLKEGVSFLSELIQEIKYE